MSFLMLLQIPLEFCPMCNNSPAIFSGTPQYFIRHVNNAGGKWNCLWTLTLRLTGRQGRCDFNTYLSFQSIHYSGNIHFTDETLKGLLSTARHYKIMVVCIVFRRRRSPNVVHQLVSWFVMLVQIGVRHIIFACF